MSDNRNYQVLVKLATWQEPRAMKMTFSPKVGVLWWAIFVSSYAVVSVRCCMHQRRWVFEPEVRYSEVRGIHLYLCICVFVLYLCTGICICQHRWRWACEPEGRCLGVRHIHLKCHSLLQLQAHLCSPYAPPHHTANTFGPIHPYVSIRTHLFLAIQFFGWQVHMTLQVVIHWFPRLKLPKVPLKSPTYSATSHWNIIRTSSHENRYKHLPTLMVPKDYPSQLCLHHLFKICVDSSLRMQTYIVQTAIVPTAVLKWRNTFHSRQTTSVK